MTSSETAGSLESAGRENVMGRFWMVLGSTLQKIFYQIEVTWWKLEKNFFPPNETLEGLVAGAVFQVMMYQTYKPHSFF